MCTFMCVLLAHTHIKFICVYEVNTSQKYFTCCACTDKCVWQQYDGVKEVCSIWSISGKITGGCECVVVSSLGVVNVL